jgi:hypothetical protein
MASLSAWVAPLVERCLSLYIQGQVDSSEFEDDGSNLRFASCSPQYAIILDVSLQAAKGMPYSNYFKSAHSGQRAREKWCQL